MNVNAAIFVKQIFTNNGKTTHSNIIWARNLIFKLLKHVFTTN
jgi:hypothetical protein